MTNQESVYGALVGAGVAASIPEEMAHWAIKIVLGAVTGLLTMGLSNLFRKLTARKHDADRPVRPE